MGASGIVIDFERLVLASGVVDGQSDLLCCSIAGCLFGIIEQGLLNQ